MSTGKLEKEGCSELQAKRKAAEGQALSNNREQERERMQGEPYSAIARA